MQKFPDIVVELSRYHPLDNKRNSKSQLNTIPVRQLTHKLSSVIEVVPLSELSNKKYKYA